MYASRHLDESSDKHGFSTVSVTVEFCGGRRGGNSDWYTFLIGESTMCVVCIMGALCCFFLSCPCYVPGAGVQRNKLYVKANNYSFCFFSKYH